MLISHMYILTCRFLYFQVLITKLLYQFYSGQVSRMDKLKAWKSMQQSKSSSNASLKRSASNVSIVSQVSSLSIASSNKRKMDTKGPESFKKAKIQTTAASCSTKCYTSPKRIPLGELQEVNSPTPTLLQSIKKKIRGLKTPNASEVFAEVSTIDNKLSSKKAPDSQMRLQQMQSWRLV
jgi:hypothetical protein